MHTRTGPCQQAQLRRPPAQPLRRASRQWLAHGGARVLQHQQHGRTTGAAGEGAAGAGGGRSGAAAAAAGAPAADGVCRPPLQSCTLVCRAAELHEGDGRPGRRGRAGGACRVGSEGLAMWQGGLKKADFKFALSLLDWAYLMRH
eukprot:41728-Pelagomonas_calceolata.AAC.1